MKRTITLLLLTGMLAGGCHSTYDYPSHKISVMRLYHEDHDYELLSVRGDSAIVVLDWSERDSKPIPFSHAEVIVKDSLLWIARDGKGQGPPTLKGTAIGTGIGLLLGAIFGYSSGSSYAGFGPGSAPSQSIGVLFFCTGVGAALGAFFSTFPDKKELFLSSGEHVELLRKISRYPDIEPDEMKYIK
jgi:hypothetical protein